MIGADRSERGVKKFGFGRDAVSGVEKRTHRLSAIAMIALVRQDIASHHRYHERVEGPKHIRAERLIRIVNVDQVRPHFGHSPTQHEGQGQLPNGTHPINRGWRNEHSNVAHHPPGGAHPDNFVPRTTPDKSALADQWAARITDDQNPRHDSSLDTSEALQFPSMVDVTLEPQLERNELENVVGAVLSILDQTLQQRVDH